MPQLPALHLEPRNALLDLTPVTNALDGIQKQQNANRDYAMQQDELAMRKQSHDLQAQNYQRTWKQQDVENMGKRAMAIDAMADGPQKQAAWQRIVQSHGADGLSPEELDYRTGPKMMAAQAGLFQDPLERQYKQAQINALNSKDKPDPVEQFILGRLQRAGSGMPAAPSAAPGPSLQPQSFTPGPSQPQALPISNTQQGSASPQMIPGVQLVADSTAPAQAASPQQDMIDTPYGRMSRSDAMELGGTMLLSPKFSAAGKAILDAANGSAADVSGLAKPTVNQIEERTLNATTQLGRLNDIMQRFDPKFLDITNRMKMTGASWTAKFGGKLKPDDEKELGRYASFRSAAVNNLNTILKELSGAAVTPQEYERIQNDQPVAGTGIFDGDDPVSFKAKADRTTRSLKSAVARLNFMRAKGLNFDRGSLDQFMSLDDVPAIIEQRGAEIERDLKAANPKADPMSIEKRVDQQLKREFGI